MTLPLPSYAARKHFNAEVLYGASGSAIRVAHYLHNWLCIAALRDQKWITPKQGVIAAELGISRRSVVRAFAVLIDRGAFWFQARYRDAEGGHFDLPFRIAFAATGVTPTGVTTEARKRPQKKAATGVTELSDYRCDRPVTLSTELSEAGEQPDGLTARGGSVSRANLPPSDAPVVDRTFDGDREAYQRHLKNHFWWPDVDGDFSVWRSKYGADAVRTARDEEKGALEKGR